MITVSLWLLGNKEVYLKLNTSIFKQKTMDYITHGSQLQQKDYTTNNLQHRWTMLHIGPS